MFKPYMHIERFGNDEVEGIELGTSYIFPKIDGTNSSVWIVPAHPLSEDDAPNICAGSRNREISLANDNAGFAKWLNYPYEEGHHKVIDGLAIFEGPAYNLYKFLCKKPHLRLYGEWLVPHTFKKYREDAWQKFYIFDVYNDEKHTYLPYESYKPLLDEFNIEYIPPLAIINNANYEHFLKCLRENTYLCPQGGDPGEGIVIKNYSYYNKYGRQTWAKIIRQEFKEQHTKVAGASVIGSERMNEEILLNKIISLSLIDKTIAKIANEKSTGWQSKYIPELFGRLMHDIVTEELWNGLKEINYGSVNFKTLKTIMIMKVKQLKPEFF